ncbi:mechanosensitive ion channel protein 10-like [Camellia sinensis]|uniref:Mechanosensitive ion channel protein n=1 Tax=Camellia sinensis var. sinensis TaxID=542762 RepID=A0A4S4D0S5_CAMSN|nr:mechanosensitive ion channel protein 10-like [Camellia sinensis]THF95802.1 hypothetical protein TEA_002821 [Camellia sinensis var. sinensis]
MQNQEEIMENTTNDQVILLMDQQDLKPPPPQSSKTATEPPNSNSREEQDHQIHDLKNLPTKTSTLRRLSFSKPKSRLTDQKYPPLSSKPILESEQVDHFISNQNYPSSTDDEDEDEDEDEDDEREMVFQEKERKRKRKKLTWRALTEWVLFFIILTCLICSITIDSLKRKVKWGLEVWKWCVMVMVVFSGRLVSGWVVAFLVVLIERNFMLREKVLYFVYGLRKSFQNCVWLALVLLAWTFMFNPHVHKNNTMLKKIFQALVAVLIGATIWLIKIVLVKVLASSFHVETYFDRMKESVFHHFILETLSGPPMEEEEAVHEEDMCRRGLLKSKSLPRKWKERGGKEWRTKSFGSRRRIDKEKLRKLSLETRASAWSVKRLVNFVRCSGLSSISKTVDEFGKAESEISNEWEARSCANRIFKNVAKPGAKYIEEEDLMRFLKRVEIHTIFPLFEGALETGRITKSSFRNWVVTAFVERKLLACSLNDTKTAVHQLHKLASAMVSIIIVVVFVLVMGLATTNVIFLVSSQLLLLGFMFQNTCKTIFESIIFVFVMHPFDIGDRCVIDGVQMVVEEMNILTTVFLRYDKEKIYYPNSVLLTKPISNFRRSPEMGDSVTFSVDMSTSLDSIAALKKSIQLYIESKPKYWNPKHTVIVTGIQNMNKMTMALCVLHTINHQNYGERTSRISELIMELKKMFENLGIKYHLLPQELHITQLNMMPLHS